MVHLEILPGNHERPETTHYAKLIIALLLGFHTILMSELAETETKDFRISFVFTQS